LELANLEADGTKMPLEVIIRLEHYTPRGKFKDSEVVAIFKRGRLIWRDRLVTKKENERPLPNFTPEWAAQWRSKSC
jgi:hypothetical protein